MALDQYLNEQEVFLSTLSLRRATSRASRLRRLSPFLSTLSLRRATPADLQIRGALDISIHALLAESDQPRNIVDTSVCISIHALLAESDAWKLTVYPMTYGFLSTLSLRRATVAQGTNFGDKIFLSTLSLRRATIAGRITSNGTKISIHALLAESDRKIRLVAPGISSISIHALLAESDNVCRGSAASRPKFLSTLSLRRATTI